MMNKVNNNSVNPVSSVRKNAGEVSHGGHGEHGGGMSEGLPKGWCISTISEIINKTGVFVDGDWIESKDQDQNGKIRLLQLADIGDGSFIDKSSRFINEEVFSRLKCTEILPGDILVARMPYPLGRACILPFIDYRAITVVDVCIIRPNKLYIDATWLMSFINSNDFATKSNLYLQELQEKEFLV